MKNKTQEIIQELTHEQVLRKTNKDQKGRTADFGPSKTQQHEMDSVDVNKIMSRYQKVGITYNKLPPSQRGIYGDFTQIQTFQEAHQAIVDARAGFMTLPSTVRARFENDPQQLFNFLNDPNNQQEAIDLGLIDKPDETTKAKLSKLQKQINEQNLKTNDQNKNQT